MQEVNRRPGEAKWRECLYSCGHGPCGLASDASRYACPRRGLSKCSGYFARYVTADEMPLALASTASRVKRISASSSVCESMSVV